MLIVLIKTNVRKTMVSGVIHEKASVAEGGGGHASEVLQWRCRTATAYFLYTSCILGSICQYLGLTKGKGWNSFGYLV